MSEEQIDRVMMLLGFRLPGPLDIREMIPVWAKQGKTVEDMMHILTGKPQGSHWLV